MKKIRRIFTSFLAAAVCFLTVSCGIFDDVVTDVKEFIGDPVGETCFLNCGITHNMTISGTINGHECDYIDLVPMEKQFYAYNKTSGNKEYVYKGMFFYQEDLDDFNNGTFWIEVGFLWDSEKNEWTTPNGAFNEMKYNENHFMASGVNLVTGEGPIEANTLVTSDEYYEAKDKLSQYVIEKHTGSDDPSDVTEESVIQEITQERYNFLLRFEEALENHDESKTKVEYVKKNGVYTYATIVDDSELELMIFSGDGDMFFYPIDGKTDNTYMMGMYAYNRATRKQRRWIREQEKFKNFGNLYAELKDKATAAKALVSTEE